MRKRFRDPRLHRLFSFQAMYAGLAPDDALAIYAVITYMDSIEGVWFPEGGMHAVPAAMATAAEKAGAMLRYAETVTEVIRRPDNGGVAGVRLESGEQIMADAVVCTLDLPVAYRPAAARSAAAARGPTRERTRRRRWSGTSACAAPRRRRSGTTTSTSAPSGPAPSTPC